MKNIIFTLPEVISLIGVFQCVYVIVYVIFRSGSFIRVVLPLLYFFTLGCAFFIDFSRGYIYEITPYYDVISWASWLLVIPLSVLLIIQMSNISKLPPLFKWWIIGVVPMAFIASVLVSKSVSDVCSVNIVCLELFDWLSVFGLIAGALSLLVIWGNRNLFSDVLRQKAGSERYWLILSLIILNIALLTLGIFNITGDVFYISLIRSLLGLAFIYLVSTSLFRIYPQALFSSFKHSGDGVLSDFDLEVVNRLEKLLLFDKIYHEASYSRSNLARELGISETKVSYIVNNHFGKSFPQLLNEFRVNDAKILLLDTDASIKVVSEEVGFNSLPSFNRSFKALVGQSPSLYRHNIIK